MLGASSVFAQPGSVQKVAKSVFTLTTFNKDGAIISSTQGVFIDNKGTAISTFKPFVGATKASVVDATGKSYEVDAIMGADELYDVAKFRIKANTAAATIAAESVARSLLYQEVAIPAGKHHECREIPYILQLLHLLYGSS